MSKKAIVYIVNSEYFNAFKVSLYSLYKNNKTFNGDLVIFYKDEDILSNFDIIEKKIKYKFLFHKINEDFYKELVFDGGVRKWTFNPAYRYEIFTLEQYDKILYLDCDTLIQKNILDIFKLKCNFGACRLNKKIEKDYSDYKGFNGGVLVIGKRYLNRRTQDTLIDMSKRFANITGNQVILNKLFSKKVKYLDQTYNVTTDIINNDLLNSGKIIHFIGEEKPWSGRFETSYNKYILNNSGSYILLRLYLRYKTVEKEAHRFLRA